MRKIGLIVIMLFIAAALLGCVSQDSYNQLQAQLASAQEQAATNENLLKAEIADKSALLAEERESNAQLQSAVASLEQNVDQLQGDLDVAQQELDRVLDTVMQQEYIFSNYRSYRWYVPITLRSYFHYTAQPRPAAPGELKAMVVDPSADDVLQVLVGQIKDAVSAYDLRSTDVINLVGAFCQSLPETNKEVETPFDATALYPVETLFKQGGDCQDNSILAAALLKRLEFNVALLVFEKEKHVAVGINAPALKGKSWEWQATRYYYLETTGYRSQVGDSPEMSLSIPQVILID